jgi:integrase
MRFTKAAIDALMVGEGKSELLAWDDDMPGFGCRVRSGGSRTWICQFRIAGRQRRETLGDVRKVRLEDARKIARQRFASAELGIDPRASQKTAITLRKAAELYLDGKQVSLRAATFVQVRYHFDKLWKPFAERRLDQITRADVAARLQEIVKAHGRTSAARARANLSAFYGWAIREGIAGIETNPVALTNNPAEGLPTRDRILNDTEVAEVWRALRDDDFGAITKLLLLTGCRKQEIGQLSWNEINFDTGVLSIPRERTKSRHALTLTLPSAALAILRAQPRRNGSDYVFGGRKGGKNGFAAWSWSKLDLDNRITTARGAPLGRWTLHDLRRTMRSGLGQLGIAPDIAERCIGHIKGSAVERTYDRYTYQPQIKAALAAWASHVEMIVAGKSDRIVPLRA